MTTLRTLSFPRFCAFLRFRISHSMNSAASHSMDHTRKLLCSASVCIALRTYSAGLRLRDEWQPLQMPEKFLFDDLKRMKVIVSSSISKASGECLILSPGSKSPRWRVGIRGCSGTPLRTSSQQHFLISLITETKQPFHIFYIFIQLYPLLNIKQLSCDLQLS